MIRANTRMHAFVLFHLEVRHGGLEGRLVLLMAAQRAEAVTGTGSH
jgi:hypothetical protein